MQTQIEDSLRWMDAAGAASDLPHARCGAASAVWKFGASNIIYSLAGRGEVCCYADLHRYDQTSGRWSEQEVRGKPPTRRRGHTLTLLGAPWEQSLVVFGGWGGDGPVSSAVKAFDINSKTWVARPVAGAPPTPRWAHTATAISETSLLIFGGEGSLPGRYFNDLHLFDTGLQYHTTRRLETLPARPAPRPRPLPARATPRATLPFLTLETLHAPHRLLLLPARARPPDQPTDDRLADRSSGRRTERPTSQPAGRLTGGAADHLLGAYCRLPVRLPPTTRQPRSAAVVADAPQRRSSIPHDPPSSPDGPLGDAHR